MSKLAKCKDCGNDISRQANACPNCGAPIKKRMGFFKKLLLVTVVVPFGLLILVGTYQGYEESEAESARLAAMTPAERLEYDRFQAELAEKEALQEAEEARQREEERIKADLARATKRAEREAQESKEAVAREARLAKQAAVNAANDLVKAANDLLDRRESYARIYAKQEVEKLLKAPSTADFSGYSDTVVALLEGGTKNDYIVKGYVDAQNGFGAMIRNKYYVILEFADASYDRIRLVSADFY